MSITTRYGDRGRTQLYSGQDVSKGDLRPEAVGTLDEAVSVLGIARSLSQDPALCAALVQLQRDCFVVGAEIATHESALEGLRARVDQAFLEGMEERRDALEAVVPMPTGFVVPGGTPVAAHLDHARTIFRRCERIAVRLWEAELTANECLLRWLNRASDYLWLLARQVEGERVLQK